jgi:nucleoside-diphosphate-sugar epimerase
MVVAPIITVFGATGFLGQRIVRHLYDRGCAVRIASRHPARGRALFGADDPRLQPIEGDIRSSQSVADAIASAHAVVNSAGLYTEHGKETFHSVHVEGAQRVARSRPKCRSRGWPQIQADSSAICRLACDGPRSGVLAKPGCHAKPGRAHAG